MSDVYDEYREPPQGCGTAIAGGLALIVFVVLVMCSMTSCKCPECLTTTETEKIIRVVERDTTIVTEADSASVHALLRCDSAYNVVLYEFVTLQGERIKASANTQKQGSDLVISLDCKEDSLEHEIQMRDSIISTYRHDTTVIREKYVPQYYKSVSTGFWILLVILLAITAFGAYKLYLKIKTGGLIGKI